MLMHKRGNNVAEKRICDKCSKEIEFRGTDTWVDLGTIQLELRVYLREKLFDHNDRNNMDMCADCVVAEVKKGLGKLGDEVKPVRSYPDNLPRQLAPPRRPSFIERLIQRWT